MPLRQNGSKRPLISAFKQVCAEQLLLCEALENVADRLGAQPDRQLCLQMAGELGPIMERAHAFEADVFFPILATIAQNEGNDSAIIAQRYLQLLRSEHDDDVCLVGEVIEALNEFGTGPSTISPDAIGYLLRGFFVGLRRHLAYENEVVRTIAKIH